MLSPPIFYTLHHHTPPFSPMQVGFAPPLNQQLILLKFSSIELNHSFPYNTTMKRMEEFL